MVFSASARSTSRFWIISVAFEAGYLVNDGGYALVSVNAVAERVGLASELDAGNVFQAEYLSVLRGADDDVFELLGRLQAAAVAQDVLERLVFALTDGTRRGFDVLLGKGGRKRRSA